MNDFLKENVKVLKCNKHYRFSNLFFRYGIRWEHDRDVILNDVKFENSILRKYLEQKTKEEDYSTLKNIINNFISKNNIKLPKPSELVIHLRCGDIFDPILRLQEDPEYVRAILQVNLIENLFKNKNEIFTNEIDSVTMVTALHFGANELNGKYFYSEAAYGNSMKVLEYFQEKINQIGYKLNIISNENFDLDLCYMSRSNYFYKGASMICHIVENCLSDSAKIYTI